MNRLVIVSNRVMLPLLANKESAGGLGVALLDALKKYGGIWFGCSGELTNKKPKLKILKENKITFATLDLPKEDYEDFYNGYSNESLWPLFHYRLDLVEYSKKSYSGYLSVNKRFAENLKPLLIKSDIIWIHDYHFILLARELRKLKCTNKLGFFLHIPWPSKENLMALPDHHELVEALLEFDVIGFQTKEYVIAFLDYVVRELNGVVETNGYLYVKSKKVKVQHFPISIDTKGFMKLANDANSSNHVS